MTSRDLLLVVLRRWYLMLLGAVLTVAGLYVAMHQPGVYFTRYEFVLLPPQTETYPNRFEDPHYGMTEMAGLVVTDFNAGKREPLIGSADTTLYGEGLHNGSRVRLPNNGSQWQPLYTKPNIEVQVVGPSAADVAAEASRIGEQLNAILKGRQDLLHIVPTMRMTALVSPKDPVVAYVGGSRGRVAIGIGAVGAAMTTILVVQFDRWRQRRQTRRDCLVPDKEEDLVPSRADRTA